MGDRVAGTRDSRRKNGEGEERERERKQVFRMVFGGERKDTRKGNVNEDFLSLS